MSELRLACSVFAMLWAGSASGQDVLYAVTNTDLITISLDDPGSVEVVGQHGLSFVTLLDGSTRGPFSLTYDRSSERLLGLHYESIAGTDDFIQSLVQYDSQTGAATSLHVLADSGVDGFVESIEYVDTLDQIIVSRDADGTITTSLETINPDGTTTQMIDTGVDNDFAVYDQSRDRFYVMDPNGDGVLRLADLTSGSVSLVTPVFSSTSDLAYSIERDTIYAYVAGPNTLVSLGDGLREQNPVSIGVVGAAGPLQGLAVVPSDSGHGCLADIDGDGVPSTTDIQLFVGLFLAADPSADFNGDGVLDSGDLISYVQNFLNEC